jgi:hypothetical protein
MRTSRKALFVAAGFGSEKGGQRSASVLSEVGGEREDGLRCGGNGGVLKERLEEKIKFNSIGAC